MSWYSGFWACNKCETTWEDVVRSDARDSQLCPGCQGEARRQLVAPTVLRASFPDGTKRFNKLRADGQVDTLLSEAKAKGQYDEAKRLLVEKDKVASSKHGDSKG